MNRLVPPVRVLRCSVLTLTAFAVWALSLTAGASPWPSDTFSVQPWLSPIPFPGNAKRAAFALLRAGTLPAYLERSRALLRKLRPRKRAVLRLRLAQQLAGIAAYKEMLQVAKETMQDPFPVVRRKTRLLAGRVLLLERRPREACRWLGAVETQPLWKPTSLGVRALLMRAECSARAGDHRTSEKALRKALPHSTLLGDWIRIRLLQAVEKSGKARKAVREGVRFLRRYKGHPLSNRVRFVVAQALERGGLRSRARVWYRRLRTRYRARGALLRKCLRAEAGLLRRAGKQREARLLLRRLLRSFPGTRAAQESLRWLRPLPTSPAFLRALARHERRRGKHAAAATTLERALRHPASGKGSWKAAALATQAFDWFRAKKYPRVVASVERFLRSYPRDRRGSRLRLLRVRAAFRRLRSDDAVRGYERFWRRHQRSRYAPLSLWWAAQLWSERSGGEARALLLFARYVKRYPRSRRSPLALLKVGLIHYRAGRWKRALRSFRALSRRRGRITTRALFWMGKCLRRLKRTRELKAVWARVRFAGDPYYHARVRALLSKKPLVRSSVSLLRLLPTVVEERQIRRSLRAWARRHWKVSLDALVGKLSREPGFRQFRELTLSGWRREARRVMRRWEGERLYPSVRPLVAARLWSLVGEPHRSIRAQARWFRGLKRKHRRGLPSRLRWRLRFPIPYPMLYQRYAKSAGVPALLMLSVTRQESLFDPRARSRAGALGIAQMMPKEGRKMATKLGLRGYNTRDLFRVSLNLRFGFLHFREYLTRARGQVSLALVSYNAGPASFERWRRLWGKAPAQDLDAFLEIGVGYRETRRYAPACLRWYSVYRAVFDKGS